MKSKFISRDILCGRHALDLQLYLFFAPLTILLIPFIESNASERRNFALWIFSSSVSFASQLILLKLFQIALINKENFRPFPVWVIFAIGTLTGAIKGLMDYVVPQYLDLPVHPGSNITDRILMGVFGGLCIVPFFAVLSYQMNSFRLRRQGLMESLVLGESLKLSNDARLQGVRQATQIAIESELSLLVSETRKQIRNTEGKSLQQQYEQISAALTSSAEELIRPLSHQLMNEQRQDFPSPPLSSIFLLALKRPNLPIAPTLFFINASLVVVVVRETTLISTILFICTIQALFSFVQIIGINAIARYVKRYKTSLLVPIFIVGSTFANVWANQFVLRSLFEEEYQFLQSQRLVLNFLWMLVFFAIVSFVANLVENESSVEKFILGLVKFKKIDEMLADQEILRIKHDIARYLHGNLQSRVMALGLTLKVQENKDQVSMDRAMGLAQSLFDSPFADFLASEDRTLAEEVAFNAAKWEGLLNIHTKIEVLDSPLSLLHIRAIGAALEEALANSLRHGLAKEVEINIFNDKQGVTVAVLDDGIGPSYTPSGLGSMLYDLVATRGWKLQHRLNGEGTILELRI